MIKESYSDQITTYLRKNLKKGYTKESLRQALLPQVHSKLEIDKAMKKVEANLASEAPVLKTKPEIKYTVLDEKDNELHVEEKKPFWKKWFS